MHGGGRGGGVAGDADAAARRERTFIEGFRAAADKRVFLELAGVPFRRDPGGGPPLWLLEVRITDSYRVGAAAPAFGIRELAYQPLPGELVEWTTGVVFVYVSLDDRRELSLAEVLGGEDELSVG